VGKGCGRVNMIPILCTHVCKWKNETCENIPGMEGGGIKKNDGDVNSSIIYLIYVRTFVNAAM
jgi:hypothetical protein